MTAPYAPPPVSGPYPTPASVAKPAKFAGLAWTALILGIVGVVGSPIIFLNNLTAVVAGVGLILGIIALFGTKKVLTSIGIVLCILAIVFTVIAQNAAVKKLDALGQQLGISAGDDKATGQTYAVGDTHRGTDVDITVAEPKAFTTGKFAAPKQEAKAVSYQVTVTNHSAKPWPAAMLFIQATAGSSAAEQVFDTEAGLDSTPSQDILPGKSLTFRLGFVDAPGDITLQVGNMGSDKVYFVQKR
ncbi:hypothetical protein [Amycolatopsis sp. H20-H5]|uniref:hypothetical protein n=1 Tax=Amycolatopsis sp. H20-H5 TaxID=3046309 RepID=UPI002DBE4BBF|nr:hypothetical protein [Amycolatopsis sp. H20-H5]MEC3978140.1 hypothetical protein [Amycolatopsis sp. H20-H5]